MILLVLLTLLALIASVALTEDFRSRAEAIIAGGLVLQTLLVGPVYLLGFTHHLDKIWLGVLSFVLSAGLLALWVIANGGVSALKALALRFLTLGAAPLEGVFRAWQRRSLVTVGAALATLAFPYMLLIAYLAPAWRDWDGLWYHEPLTGFAIQNHGFAPVDLPTSLQVINGVQRLCESTQTWFAIWGGRQVVDAANVFFTPLLAASMFALARRYTKDVVSGVAWASALVLMPAYLRLAQSTMVDPESAALLLAASYWVTHPDLDRRNAFYAVLSLTLAVGAKIWSVIPVGILSLVLLGRLVARRKANGGKATLALIGGGTFAVAGMQALTYLRNWLNYKNPLWPMINYDNARFGIHWKGAYAVEKVNFNDPFDVFYTQMLAAPYSTMGHGHAWQVTDYGFAWAWVVLPLAALACAALALRWAVTSVAVLFRLRRPSPADAEADGATVLALVAGASLYFSPALHIPRYHVASMGMLAACLCWFSSRSRASRLADEAAVLGTLGAVMMLYWAPRRAPWICVFEPAQIVKWIKTPYPLREVNDIGNPRMLVSPVWPSTGLAREREVKAGDVVGFDNIDFLSLLWNDDYSNEVVWLSDPDPLAQAKKLGAVWIYSRSGTALSNALARADSGYEHIGPLEAEQQGSVWRRRK